MVQKDLDRFVEGRLTGVQVSSDEMAVSLSLCEADGCRWKLEASEVSDFMVLEMRLQNIVDRGLIWDASHTEVALREKLAVLVHGSSRRSDETEALPVTSQLELIMSKRAELVELEPVFGAHVLILAAKFALEKL